MAVLQSRYDTFVRNGPADVPLKLVYGRTVSTPREMEIVVRRLHDFRLLRYHCRGSFDAKRPYQKAANTKDF